MWGNQAEQVAFGLIGQHFDEIGQVLAFRGQFDDRLVHHGLDRHSPRCVCATLLQLLDALPNTPDLLAQFAVGGFETAHGPALLFQVGQRLQTVFGLEAIQLSVSLAETGL